MTCELCGGGFTPSRDRARIPRYCSRRCGALAAVAIKRERAKVTRACEWCGTEFSSTRRAPKRFCGKSCANQFTARRGSESPFYMGADGLTFNGAMGRWVINGRRGSQTLYSRAVMAAHLGRELEPEELVHHKNEDPTDDRIENLELTTRSEHIKMHMPALIAGRS